MMKIILKWFCWGYPDPPLALATKLALVCVYMDLFHCPAIDRKFFHKGCRKYTSFTITFPFQPFLVN